MRSLDVHLHGERIGTLFPAGEGDYRFAYAPEVVERVGAGTSLLSTALPARPEPFGAEASRAYVDGLLPEGARRARIARELGLDADDGYGLLSEIGRDCAGAVTFLPQGTEAEAPSEDTVPWLTDEELEELVGRGLPRRLFGSASEPRMRASLAGERYKLALVREEGSGRWAWPEPGLPSTHILKPEAGECPGLVANEMFCMTVAHRAGLAVARTEHEVIAGRPCLVSRRFDRAGVGRSATRVHQEDFCQALGFPPPCDVAAGKASEEDAGGPNFAEACGLLTALNRRNAVPALLSAAVFNYALGNGDAHGKNFALLHGERRQDMAPLYDLTSTAVYDLPIHTGMVLASDYDEAAYLLEMDSVCQECGFDLDRFRVVVAATAAKIESSLETVVEQAHSEGWHAPVIDEIVELAGERARGLGYEVEY